jgi:hypothetical protein
MTNTLWLGELGVIVTDRLDVTKLVDVVVLRDVVLALTT